MLLRQTLSILRSTVPDKSSALRSWSLETGTPLHAHVPRSECIKLQEWSKRCRSRPQTYYKLSYVDRRIDGVEQRICEDIPKLCDELGELVREWCNWCGNSQYR